MSRTVYKNPKHACLEDFKVKIQDLKGATKKAATKKATTKKVETKKSEKDKD